MTISMEYSIAIILLWGVLCFCIGMTWGARVTREAYEQALRELRELT